MCNWPWPAWPNSDAVTWCCLSTFCIRTRKSGSAAGGTAMSSMNGSGRVEPFRRYSVGTTLRASRQYSSISSRSCGLHARRNASRFLRRTRSTTCAELVAHVGQRVAVLLDQQHRLGLGRDQQVVAHVALAGQAQVPAIHQVAGAGLQRQDLHAPPWPRFPGDRRAAAPRRGACGSGCVATVASVIRASVPSEPTSSSRQVEVAVGEHVGQVIAAAIDQALRLVVGDQLGSSRRATRPGESTSSSRARGSASAPVARRAARGRPPAPCRRPARSAGSATCRRAEPYFSQWLPPASIAITLPIVVTLAHGRVGAELPALRPQDSRLSCACTTPGCTRTVLAARLSRMRRM